MVGTKRTSFLEVLFIGILIILIFKEQ